MADRPMHNTSLRRTEQILFWAGLALVAAGLVLAFVPGSPVPPGLLVGAGLAALGLNILLGGDLVAGPEPRSFTARGQVVRGRLHVLAGMADLAVEAGENDRIAAVRFGPFGQPAFKAEDGVASLGLRNPRLLPNIAHWQAGLAGNILWDIDARSSLGHLHLDLSGLRLESVSARSALGWIHVVCPARGCVQMALRTTAGGIAITIPPKVGARIAVTTGALGSVTVGNPRLLSPGPRRYVTPDYESASAQVDITIEAAAGEVLLN